MIGATLVWLAYYGQFQAHLTDKEIVGGPGAQTTSAKAVEAQEKGAVVRRQAGGSSKLGF